MNKPQFRKGDLVQWKHGTDVGVVIGFGHDTPSPTAQLTIPATREVYALVHWQSGNETKVYEKHNTWHGVIIMARAQEENINDWNSLMVSMDIIRRGHLGFNGKKAIKENK